MTEWQKKDTTILVMEGNIRVLYHDSKEKGSKTPTRIKHLIKFIWYITQTVITNLLIPRLLKSVH